MSDLRGFDVKLGKNSLGYLANSQHADPATSHTHIHIDINIYMMAALLMLSELRGLAVQTCVTQPEQPSSVSSFPFPHSHTTYLPKYRTAVPCVTEMRGGSERLRLAQRPQPLGMPGTSRIGRAVTCNSNQLQGLKKKRTGWMFFFTQCFSGKCYILQMRTSEMKIKKRCRNFAEIAAAAHSGAIR